MSKYKKESIIKISWQQFDNYTEKIYKELSTFLKQNNLKIDLIIPIIRGEDILAVYLSHKLDTIRILPFQYKYFKDNKVKKLLNIEKSCLLEFEEKNPTILLVEGNHSSGKIANLALSDIKKIFPKSKIIYVALAKDYFYKDSVNSVDFTTCGFYTNENRKLTKEECTKLKIDCEKIIIFPWENEKEELQGLNNEYKE